MKIIKNISLYTGMLALLLLAACDKLVEPGLPADRVVSEAVFNDDATAISAMSGIYIQMLRTNQQLGSGGITLLAGLSADEMYNVTASPTMDEFTGNALSAGNNTVRNNLWTVGYNLVFQANSVIEGLQRSSNVSAATKNQLMGEAKFVRAFCHFYLLNLFGDIPLVTATSYQENAVLPRAPMNEVYGQVIQDLADAKDLLPVSYVAASRVRPNKWTAAALLARVWLYTGEWQKAVDQSTEIINAGSYSLVANLNNVFLPTSNETIWQVMPTSTTLNTWDGNNFIPGTGAAPSYPLTTTLSSAFAAGDQRKTNWTKAVTIGANNYTYAYKYKIKTATTLQEYYGVFRLAEQYLIRAEANAQLNKIMPALQDVNVIRNRAGLPNSTATDAASLLLAIEKERQLELFAEWGHRWFDLKRTGRADAVLGVKPGWQATDALYPIPAMEILRNKALTQNPGY